MSEYTPTTEQIQNNYIEGMNAFYGERGASEYGDQFRRWLNAHDAEVRASVVTEESGWEYAQGFDPGTGEDWYIGKSFGDDPSRFLDEGYTLLRRKLGEWEEVPDAT